jgi:hypothetical protein
MKFDGCYFHNRECSVNVQWSTFSNCVFLNHSGPAMIFGAGTISDSLFVRNDSDQGYGMGPTVRSCILILNRVEIVI